MKNEISYEFAVLEYDQHGDIYENHFFDDLPTKEQIAKTLYVSTAGWDVELIKRIGNDEDGLIDRTQALLQEGVVPDLFEDGSSVPQRFRKELV
jgi:hypothetical protein